MNEMKVKAEDLKQVLVKGILEKWYPLVIDTECGGYFTNVTHDWKLSENQEKMIVSQARHVWTLSKVYEFLGGIGQYKEMAVHGFDFLKNKMWDLRYGGFFQIRDRDGGTTDVRGWRDEKRAYGNAFGLYGLAALYKLTHDDKVLDFAKTVFRWIEERCYDPKEKGYYQFITPDSQPFDASSEYKTIALDSNELGFKDQNSSIHLLEAMTEFYQVWPDSFLRNRLQSLLELIRDVMVAKQGYLQLFFHPGWKPVSFRNKPKKEREANYGLDHVSFGHDYETAFLMLEASHALGIKNDKRTLTVAKKMLDHALKYGFDEEVGGFYDGGYYFKGSKKCSIIMETKNWWAQAEGLNALLLFSKLFPDKTRYAKYFERQWNYVQKYIIDSENGDWFEGGIDKEPHFRTGLKSHMWKCTYHTGRALMNCISMLEGDPNQEINKVIKHWRKTAKEL